MKKLGFAIIILSLLISCSKDAKNSNEIIGSWSIKTEVSDNPNLTSELLYTFESNETITIERVIVANTSNEILGYRYRAIGNYSIDGDKLSMNRSQIFNHDDLTGLYSDFGDLELSTETSESQVDISFSNSYNQLHFEYQPCEPYENCVSNQMFERKN